MRWAKRNSWQKYRIRVSMATKYKHELIDMASRLSPAELQYSIRISAQKNGTKLTNNFYMFGHHIGYSEIEFIRRPKGILWTLFYPLHEVNGLERRGIGTIAHVESLLAAVNYGADETYFVNHMNMTNLRAAQLSRMGIICGEKMYDYMQKSISYANSRGFDFNNPFERRLKR